MINHVVLFKLNEYAETRKEQIRNEIKHLLEGLKQQIPQVKYLEVGVNYQLHSRGFDIALITHFESIEDLDQYRVHPEHLKVVKRIGETTSERAAVDFEF